VKRGQKVGEREGSGVAKGTTERCGTGRTEKNSTKGYTKNGKMGAWGYLGDPLLDPCRPWTPPGDPLCLCSSAQATHNRFGFSL